MGGLWLLLLLWKCVALLLLLKVEHRCQGLLRLEEVFLQQVNIRDGPDVWLEIKTCVRFIPGKYA